VSDTAEYIARVTDGRDTRVDVHTLTRDQRLGDALFTGLRLVEGIDVAEAGRRYGVDVMDRYGTALQPFLDEGLLVHEDGRLRLTRAGMLLANEVMAVFV
jgi:oxygen-independent coproporphyrinogen-3 oxidase